MTPTAAEYDELHRAMWLELAGPGDWLTGGERLDVAKETRAALHCRLCGLRAASLSPSAVAGTHEGTGTLSALAVDTVHRVAVDAKRLTRSWAEHVMARLGEGAYVEIVGVVSSVTLLDMYRRALGEDPWLLPAARPGGPGRTRPDGVGDVGAWVSQETEKTRANVSRALTLVPNTNAIWRKLVDLHYSRGREFSSLTWDDRALTRPQTELVAATVTSINECFY